MDINNRDFKTYLIGEKLKMEFSELDKITDKWGYIRQAYMEMMPLIMERSHKDIRNGITPYFFDWVPNFSPIERIAWNSIRSNGGSVLYPQFPLFNYFIDFANPYLRIGLEVDGKDYHDTQKDKIRDEKLADFGWKIFRVSGSECNRQFKAAYELDEMEMDGSVINRHKELENWLLNTCDGVIVAIEEIFFKKPDERNSELYELARATLEKHKLADFQIPL